MAKLQFCCRELIFNIYGLNFYVFAKQFLPFYLIKHVCIARLQKCHSLKSAEHIGALCEEGISQPGVKSPLSLQSIFHWVQFKIQCSSSVNISVLVENGTSDNLHELESFISFDLTTVVKILNLLFIIWVHLHIHQTCLINTFPLMGSIRKFFSAGEK